LQLVALGKPLGGKLFVPVFVWDDEIVIEQEQVQRPARLAAAMTKLLTVVTIGSRQKAPPTEKVLGAPGTAPSKPHRTPQVVSKSRSRYRFSEPSNPSLFPNSTSDARHRQSS